MAKEEPLRSCVACGMVRPKRELIRFVITPDRFIVPDLKHKLPGRGAYTCFKSSCVATAVSKKQFARAFRGEVTGVSQDLPDQLANALVERILGYIAIANKAGKVISGSDQVLESLRSSKKVGLVIIAGDISPDIGTKVWRMATQHEIPCFSIADKATFGDILGKSIRSIVAFEQGGFVQALCQEFERYRNFLDGGTR